MISDFTRYIWTSEKARKLWEPRITDVGKALKITEFASVIRGVRLVALTFIEPEKLQTLSSGKLPVTVLERTGMNTDGYSASSIDVDESNKLVKWQYRVAVSIPAAVQSIITAWNKKDDTEIGRLLGYPECCIKFFNETWKCDSVDPTWLMNSKDSGNAIEANILLRWLGLRWVPHLPCSFSCEKTIAFGKQMRQVMQSQGFTKEANWLDEMLEWPMEWSALHGIGEVVTPVVTMNFRTDVSHERQVIERPGKEYPEEGASGLRFPYKVKQFKLKNNCCPMEVLSVYENVFSKTRNNYWLDNGFSSAEAMDNAHLMIFKAMGNYKSELIIDLGAGNGELLRKIGRGVGVECDEGRVERCVWFGVKHGFIQDVEKLFPGQHFDMALISNKRFGELQKLNLLVELYEWLQQYVENVLIYYYDESPMYVHVTPSKGISLDFSLVDRIKFKLLGSSLGGSLQYE